MLDIIQQMFNEIAGNDDYRSLSPTEERNLIKNNPRSKWEPELICHNLRIPLNLVLRYHNVCNIDDLYQECLLEIVKKAPNFKTTMGNRFSTYIFWLCRGTIANFLRNAKRSCDQKFHGNNARPLDDLNQIGYDDKVDFIKIDSDNYTSDELSLYEDYYINGYNITEIRKRLGWTSQKFKDVNESLKNKYTDILDY